MYAKISNGAVEQFPYTLGMLRRDNPRTSFPKSPGAELLSEWGLEPVRQADVPPIDDRTQTLTLSSTPVLEGAEWVLNWVVGSRPQAEIDDYDRRAEEILRNKRDGLLSETDWMALSDTPPMSEAWAAYRQALRDITSHENWPHLKDADWPVKPE